MPQFSKKSRILTVSGGKGGTGKTFVAVNLAYEMAKRLSRNAGHGRSIHSNNRILLFDADYHLPNAHIFIGQRITPCLDRILKKPESLSEYIVNTNYGIDLLSFGGDEKRINDIGDNINSGILDELTKLENQYDWIIVDTGAGMDKIIIKQILFSDLTLLVTSPDATSIIDCYKLLKFISNEKTQHNIEICVNQVSSFEEGYMCFQKIQGILSQFLIPINTFFAGAVYFDRKLFTLGLQKGIPIASLNQSSHFNGSMKYIWDHIMKKPVTKRVESFFDRIFLR